MLKILFLLNILVSCINGSTKPYKEPTHPEFLRVESLRAKDLKGVSNFQPYLEVVSLPPPYEMEMNVTSNLSLVTGPIIHVCDLMTAPGFTWPCNATDYHTFFLTRHILDFKYWGYHEYHLWIVINIPGDEIQKGQEIFAYIPPVLKDHPKDDKFCPVYRAVVYKQPKFIKLFKNWFMFPRTFTTVENFTATFGMKQPMAAFDFYVDDISNKTGKPKPSTRRGI